jgi:heme A synthase
MAESQRSNSRIRTYLVAAGAGVAVAVVDYLLGVWMAARGLHAEMTFVDEILLAIFTCALVFVIEYRTGEIATG